MKKIIKIVFGLLLLVSFHAVSSPVYGAEELKEGQGNFSVTPLSPETGLPQSSYYDLLVKPGEQKKLKVKIHNSSSKDIKVKAEVNDATTNNNGLTSYKKSEKRDPSLKIGLSDMVKNTESVITVPQNSTKDLEFNLAVPDGAFEGEILGGLRFTTVDSAAPQESEKSKTAVSNKVAYTVAVLLRENKEKVSPKMAMPDVITEQRNYRNYISAKLQNSAPRIIKKLSVQAQVYKKGEKELLYEASNSEMRMAPNSNFLYGISLEDQPFIPGNYTMKVTGKADGEDFSFEKDFSIEKKESRAFNKNAVFVKQDKTVNIWLYLVLSLLILILVGIVYMMYRNKKKNEK